MAHNAANDLSCGRQPHLTGAVAGGGTRQGAVSYLPGQAAVSRSRLHECLHQVCGSVALVVRASQQHLPGTILQDGVRQSHGGTRQLWQPAGEQQQQQQQRGTNACAEVALQQRGTGGVKQRRG